MEGVEVALLPEDFVVPTLVAGPRFKIRPITVHDVVKDYDAIMCSRERLWKEFGEQFGWPTAELTFEQALIDVAWLQKEGQLRRSFTYAVLTPDEERLIGRVHLAPSREPGSRDVGVVVWVRTEEAESSLEKELEEFVREWVTVTWPFTSAKYPGQDMSWDDWRSLFSL